MLFLLFELGKDRYALDVRQIAAVLPLVGIKQIPKAPQAMNNMMEMARRMGNGDVMLGMTKMMEMMSRMDGMGGGMMGGPKER